eukprot:TRINITY_DN87386_c0_g1_i1.p1 TRINITY_DN87386_c0_g1~~TRINITY_DN87386_c0_g1_i1.p1  ORF type:complete len:287 (+),score=56.23 TRINITY_DN87386_c0_g1_i1:96-956(+)
MQSGANCRRQKSFVAVPAVAAAALLCISRFDGCWVPGLGPSRLTLSAKVSASREALARTALAPVDSSKPESVGPEENDALPRRGFAAAAAAVASLLLASGGSLSKPARAFFGNGEFDLRDVVPPIPPKPSRNPFIRRLQEKSWQLEPWARMHNFLKVTRTKFSSEGPFSAYRVFVHWKPAPDNFKFDIMNQDNFKEAARLGKIVIDTDMTGSGGKDWNDIEVYAYKDDEARQYCQEKLIIEDLCEIPFELQEAILTIMKTPFPEYVPPKKKSDVKIAAESLASQNA